MSRSAVFVSLAVTAALGAGPHRAAAERASGAAPTPQARLVEVLPRAAQALLYDKNRGEYVVVKRGDRVQGFRVSAIDRDQLVLTSRGRPAEHYVLPLSPEPDKKGSSEPLRILDPYGSAAPREGPSSLEVEDPYGTGEPIPSVKAPPAQRAGSGDQAPIDPFANKQPAPSPDAPAAKADTAEAPLDPFAAAGEPAAKPAAKPAPPQGAAAPARQERRAVHRAELDSALEDFEALRKEVRLERPKGGGIRIAQLARGSFLYRLGLREGDLIRSVAGRAIDTPDRAAAAYVELTVARSFDVVLERGGAPLTIHYAVKQGASQAP